MTSHSYFVVMQDFGKRGREAIVDPEITYRGVVDRVRSGEYKDILFIHHIDYDVSGAVDDVTEAIMEDAGVLQQAAE